MPRNVAGISPRLRRLRMILSVAVIVAIFVAMQLQAGYKQRLAVEAIVAQEGHISYHCGHVPPPHWLRDWLGTDTLQPVLAACLTGPRFDDESLPLVRGFSDLYILSLADSRVTDDGLRHVAHLTQLRFLDLSQTSVTAKGIEHLSELTRLKWLYLRHSGVTHDELSRLRSILPRTKIVLEPVELWSPGTDCQSTTEAPSAPALHL